MRIAITALVLSIVGCSDRHSTSADQMAADLKLVRLTILTEVIQQSTNSIDPGVFETAKHGTERSRGTWFVNTNYGLWKETALDKNTNHLSDTALRLVLDSPSEASEITFGGQVVPGNGKAASADLIRVTR